MRIKNSGYLVVLDESVGDEQDEAILAALRLIRGVAAVQMIPSSPNVEKVAVQRERTKIRARLFEWARELES